MIAYVLDSGVASNHAEFDGDCGTSRVRQGIYCNTSTCGGRGDELCSAFVNPYRSTNDWLSHGTGVASVIGGRNVGVAKQIQIVPVKIVDCHGFFSSEGAVAGLNWIMSASNPDANHRPALLNISLAFLTSDSRLASWEQLISVMVGGSVNAAQPWVGIPVITSANNQNYQHCSTLSPARLSYNNAAVVPGSARVISVGGSARRWQNGVLKDVRWQCDPTLDGTCPTGGAECGPERLYGSNFGRTVDIYAPAHFIDSAYTNGEWYGKCDSRNTQTYRSGPISSGTSFAAPFATGVAARILQAEPWLNPKEVWERMRSKAYVTTDLDSTYYPDDPATTENESLLHNGRLLLWRYSSDTCAGCTSANKTTCTTFQ